MHFFCAILILPELKTIRIIFSETVTMYITQLHCSSLWLG